MTSNDAEQSKRAFEADLVRAFVRAFDLLVDAIEVSGEDGGNLAADPVWGPVLRERERIPPRFNPPRAQS
jgi:hypothetical protein